MSETATQLQEIRAHLTRHDQRFEAIDRRFEAIDRRFESIDQRFDAMDRRFDAMEIGRAHV